MTWSALEAPKISSCQASQELSLCDNVLLSPVQNTKDYAKVWLNKMFKSIVLTIKGVIYSLKIHIGIAKYSNKIPNFYQKRCA